MKYLKELVKENKDRIVYYKDTEINKKYMSVFNYSNKYGGTYDSFKYYNNYVIEIGGLK